VRHSTVLAEIESMRLLAPFGVPFPRHVVATSVGEATEAARAIGFPVVIKASGEGVAHKSERGLVELGIVDEIGVERAMGRLARAVAPNDGTTAYLVSEMVAGRRELLIGAHRDPSFGVVLVVGWGGVLAEAIDRVATAPAPVDRRGVDDLCARAGLDVMLGAVRGEAAVDRAHLLAVLRSVADAMRDDPSIATIDLNPLKVTSEGHLIAVDGLVELSHPATTVHPRRFSPSSQHFAALFNPTSVVVVGASTHPGKFGFVMLHNLLAAGFVGRVAATNPSAPEILGVQTVPSVNDLEGSFDLAVICTPSTANEQIVKDCALKGAKAIVVASAGYRESGDVASERSLVGLCSSLNVMMIGPNGQGVVSTPASLCAQMVAPFPPVGRISIVSQSGNLVSSFENMALASGVGVARAVSVGNSAQVGVADFVRHLGDDSATAVVIAYVEDPSDGRDLADAIRSTSTRKPVVVLKGGRTSDGNRAALSHTGALTSDSRVFDGAMRAAGAIMCDDPDSAFDVAAACATLPLPRGPRTVVLTTVGGWGVLTADRLALDTSLQLIDLPDDLLATINGVLPPRWSRSNPIDCAGGETRDTIPLLIDATAAHPMVDAVVVLGLGIQSNQASLMAGGPFAADPDVKRVIEFHNRQDERYVEAAVNATSRYGKPVLVATELVVTDPRNQGPATARRLGAQCFASGPRAIRALGAMANYAANVARP